MKNKKGFTIIELLITILFIGITVTIFLSFSLKSTSRIKLRATARDITSGIYKIKAQAAKVNRAIRMTFTNNSYEYEWWDSTDSTWKKFRDPRFSMQKTSKVVKIVNPPDFAMNPRGLVVYPDGTNQFDLAGTQTIQLESPGVKGTDRITIQVLPLGGVNVKKEFR